MKIDVEVLRELPRDWDTLIKSFPGKTLFHESCWLAHVAAIEPASRIEVLQLSSGGEIVGYMPMVRVRKHFLPIAGSPLPGTGTNYQGPLVRPDVPLMPVMESILRRLRSLGVAHVELAHPALDQLDLAALRLEADRNWTHMVPIPETAAQAFAQLKSTCRNRVRKGEKNGLRLELTSDEAVVDHFIAQYAEVYGKQGLVLPWGREVPLSLFRHLQPAGRVWPLLVWHNDDVVAAGLFPFDEHAVYFWGAASWIRFHHLCPNEFLHWHVIRLACEKGIPQYNMCGGESQFKDKFGGQDVPYLRLNRSFLPGLRMARGVYARAHLLGLRLRGLFSSTKVTARSSAEEGDAA